MSEDSEFFAKCRKIGLKACVDHLTQCIEHRHKITKNPNEPRDSFEFLQALSDLEIRIKESHYDPPANHPVKRMFEHAKQGLETVCAKLENLHRRKDFRSQWDAIKYRERLERQRTTYQSLISNYPNKIQKLRLEYEVRNGDLLIRCKELRARGEAWSNEGVARNVPWVILPKGSSGAELAKSERSTGFGFEIIEERFSLICDLNPSRIYKGVYEFSGYFAFLFDACPWVVFESNKRGNAIYAVRGDWVSMSKMTKAKLMHMRSDRVRRIVHKGDWLWSLKMLLEGYY